MHRLRRAPGRRCDRGGNSPGVEPAAIEAAMQAQQQELQHRDDVRDALMRDLEAARFAADRAFRQYDATDPQNRLVAAELELRGTALSNV